MSPHNWETLLLSAQIWEVLKAEVQESSVTQRTVCAEDAGRSAPWRAPPEGVGGRGREPVPLHAVRTRRQAGQHLGERLVDARGGDQSPFMQ